MSSTHVLAVPALPAGRMLARSSSHIGYLALTRRPLLLYFVSLPRRLTLWISWLDLPLPDIQPGALPVLDRLHIETEQLRTALPASWGAGAGVLPALRSLDITAQITGTLPAGWAHGFPQLTRLVISTYADGTREGGASPGRCGTSSGASLPLPAPPALEAGAGANPPILLPAEWATGFPCLEVLALARLELTGSFPDAWLTGGFPALTAL